jgi:carbon monoxide dehydrogenase subunit G
MSSLIMSTQVSAPIERTFEVFTELEKAVERIPGITELELLSEGPFGEGTRWRETRLMFKKEAVEEMWVTGFDPPNSYTVEANSHGMLYQTLFEFLPEGDKTTVRWTFNGTPQTLGTKIMSPILGLLFNGVMKKCLQGDLDALRDAAEGEAPSADS